jgi:hypothetical protein
VRALALTILVIGMIAASVPVRAQTYDPNYPVCVQVSRIEGSYITCGYTSMAQCQMSVRPPSAMLDQPIFRAGI